MKYPRTLMLNNQLPKVAKIPAFAVSKPVSGAGLCPYRKIAYNTHSPHRWNDFRFAATETLDRSGTDQPFYPGRGHS